MPRRVLLALLLLLNSPARGDETCMSPYMPKITGQEDWIYVWTLGVEGLGDGSDKLS
jgi:methanethiol oxidase